MVKIAQCYVSEAEFPAKFDTFEEASKHEMEAALRAILPRELFETDDAHHSMADRIADDLVKNTNPQAWSSLLSTLDALHDDHTPPTIEHNPKGNDNRPVGQRRMRSILAGVMSTKAHEAGA